jgi:hypothetical protein
LNLESFLREIEGLIDLNGNYDLTIRVIKGGKLKEAIGDKRLNGLENRGKRKVTSKQGKKLPIGVKEFPRDILKGVKRTLRFAFD